MQAGKLRHRITIQERVQIQDRDSGEMINGWQDWPRSGAKHWASIEPLSARDFIAARTVQSQVTGRIVLRYREGLDPTMRILYRNKVYSIHGRLPDPNSGLEYLTLPVSEGVRDS